MNQNSGSHSNWRDGDGWQPTADPGPGISVTAMAEEAPTLTVATIVGVTLVVLVAIVAVFLLGVLIDCRQQRIIEKRMGVKRSKSQKRVSAHPEADHSSIVNNMEEPELSPAPAEVLRNIP